MTDVSIPSVSGRVFRLGRLGVVGSARGCFNPLCVGAGLQTYHARCLESGGGGFNPLCVGAGLQTCPPSRFLLRARCFNPLCVGAGLQTMCSTGLPGRSRKVSIPSVSGRVFRLQAAIDAYVNRGVSIPSVSGRVFRPSGDRSPSGASAPFQSPLCRGGSSDLFVSTLEMVPRHVSIPSVSGRVFRLRFSCATIFDR